MRNSIAQGLFGAIIQLQPLPWDDSTHERRAGPRPGLMSRDGGFVAVAIAFGISHDEGARVQPKVAELLTLGRNYEYLTGKTTSKAFVRAQPDHQASMP